MRGSLKTWFLILTATLGGCGGKSDLWNQADFPLAKEYPFVMKLIDPISNLACTGVQLSDRALLTAAHCITRQGRFVAVGPAGVAIALEKARLGEGTGEDTGDLALLVTEDPLPSPRYPKLGTSLQVGDSLKVIGYGCTDLSTGSGQGRQQKGENRVEYVSDFAYLLSPLPRGDARGLIGAGNSAGLCFGDSGAPALRGELDELVGLGHAVGTTADGYVSLLVDLTQERQRTFLQQTNASLKLGIGFAQ